MKDLIHKSENHKGDTFLKRSVHVPPHVVHGLFGENPSAYVELMKICHHFLNIGAVRQEHVLSEETADDVVRDAITDVLQALDRRQVIEWDIELTRALERKIKENTRDQTVKTDECSSSRFLVFEDNHPSKSDFVSYLAEIEIMKRAAVLLVQHLPGALDRLSPQRHDILVVSADLHRAGVPLRDPSGGNLPSDSNWRAVLSAARSRLFSELTSILSAEDPDLLLIVNKLVRSEDASEILDDLRSLAESY